MTGLSYPDATGAFVKASKQAWVSDASGTFQPAKNGWAADATGTYKKFWPYMVNVDSFTGAKGATGYPSYYKLTLNWAVSNADHVELRLAGSSAVLYSGTATSYVYTGVPGTKYTFNLRAIAADGSFTDSSALSVQLDPLPAPANFRRTSGLATSSNWSWNAMANVNSYEVVDTLASNAVKGSINAPTASWYETALIGSTTYERAVRAKLGSSTSPISNKVRYTTPSTSTSAPGTYDFRAIYAEAWGAISGWRGVGSGAMHGDGDNWGHNDGVLLTMFLYQLSQVQALHGRVTRFKIQIKRDSVAGYSSPQGNHFAVHTAIFRPPGSPVPYIGAQTDAGSLAWGQEGLFDLPVSWGQALIDNAFGSVGIIWGWVLARYMRGPALAADPDQGHIYITLG